MRSFGSNRIEAGELLDELLALGCTVIAPTFTYDLEQPAPAGDRPSQNGWAYDEWMPPSHERRFDIRGQHLSLSEMGIFPATLLSRSERARGNHPINSFAGVGPRASEIIDMQAPHRVYGPFEKLCEDGGLVLLVGVDYTTNTPCISPSNVPDRTFSDVGHWMIGAESLLARSEAVPTGSVLSKRCYLPTMS